MGDISVTTIGVGRTFLESVQLALRGCGLVQPSTLANPDKSVAVAMNAAQHALSRIWSYSDWAFREQWEEIELLESKFWYPLSEDFEEMLVGPRASAGIAGLQFKEYRELLGLEPGLRFPAEGGGLDMATEEAGATQYDGEPQIFTLASHYIGIYPRPSADFITVCPVLWYSYRCICPFLVADGDLLRIDSSLLLAHHYLTMAGIKESLMYQDAPIDEQRAASVLKKVAIRRLYRNDGNYTFHPGY